MMDAPTVLSLAEAIWRRVPTEQRTEGFELHEGCETDDPNDCALFGAIEEEILKANASEGP